MKTNIGKAISLLNTVTTTRPELDKINAAITILKHEDEARQPLVPEQAAARTWIYRVNDTKKPGRNQYQVLGDGDRIVAHCEIFPDAEAIAKQLNEHAARS